MNTTRIRTRFEVADERFQTVAGDEHVEILYDQGRWLEGPVYSRAWRCLLVSDIPNDRLLRWDEHTGEVSVWRQPAEYCNGHHLDRHGRLLSCQQGTRTLTRTEFDGTVTTLAERYDGRRFNSPNDVVERADGSLWFTDPSYGIDSDYEGFRAASELDGCHVYRIDLDGTITRVADDFIRPCGIAFSPDERTLYLGDCRRKHLRRFAVGDDGALSGGEVFADCDAGVFDGIRVDHLGRVWAAAFDGLHCFDPDGTLLGKLLLPEICANLTFGGQKGNRLFVAASNTLFSLYLNVNGATYPAATYSTR